METKPKMGIEGSSVIRFTLVYMAKSVALSAMSSILSRVQLRTWSDPDIYAHRYAADDDHEWTLDPDRKHYEQRLNTILPPDLIATKDRCRSNQYPKNVSRLLKKCTSMSQSAVIAFVKTLYNSMLLKRI